MKKAFSILLILAIITAFGFTLVACDKGGNKDEVISAADAEKVLTDPGTGAIIAARKDMFFTAKFTEVLADGTTIVGEASIAEDDSVQASVSTVTSVAHRHVTVTEGSKVTETEYFACYDAQDDGYGEMVKYDPYYFGKVNDGTGWVYTVTKLSNKETIDPMFNTYVSKCGAYDGRNLIEDVIDGFLYGDGYELVYSGVKTTVDGAKVTVITLTYSYTNAKSVKITGTSKVTVNADGKIKDISVSESDGYKYDASYVYNIGAIKIPLVPTSYFDDPDGNNEWEIQA